MTTTFEEVSDLMTLEMTPVDNPWVIRSDRTPEKAIRTGPSIDTYMIGWLPGRLLSFDEACSAMILDETLSDHSSEDPEYALAVAELRAAELGLELRQVVAVLWLRDTEGIASEVPAPVRP
ncbi:hypothetical protein GPX89_00665 [Nocardia sp. ET3-3]|uniref:Uncharacterized protein n=1 Tax=Nocardia terrae TaxID=2675851 RepID=A0A7K1UN28_9NOCA|nr:hypothetical protein [Nocardia terrae]MVU75753.1 hypothetical protein [Nocardia terrae]